MLRSSTAPAIWRDGTRRTSTATFGCERREALDVRQQAVDRRLVGAHDDAAAAHLLQLLDGGLRLAGEPEQALGVVLEQAPGLGQRAVAGGPVEQPLAQLVLDPADRLADGRLGPVQPAGGRRKSCDPSPRRGMRRGPAAA